MAEYGITESGPNIKRLDVILDEMHAQLSEAWGVNTKQNSESFINHLLTNFADMLAELWEFGEQIYYSQYPNSADGVSLDYAASLGGVKRLGATKSIYPVSCTLKDGTVLDTTTTVSTTTAPTVFLNLLEGVTCSKSNCTGFYVRANLASADYYDNTLFVRSLDNVSESIWMVSAHHDALGCLTQFHNSLARHSGFEVSEIDEDALEFWVEDTAAHERWEVQSSGNIDTSSKVIMTLDFATEDTGDIYVPEGAVANIVSGPSDLYSVTNHRGYTPGRNLQTDTELRESYVDRVFTSSRTMIESIKASVLNISSDIQNVIVLENDTAETVDGIAPHSIRVIVDVLTNSHDKDIAEAIFASKAAGIGTVGAYARICVGSDGEQVVVRFDKPSYVYVWWSLTVAANVPSEEIPSQTVDQIKQIVVSNVSQLEANENVRPQIVVSDILDKLDIIDSVDAQIGVGTINTQPSSYSSSVISITNGNKAVTTVAMVSVSISAPQS